MLQELLQFADVPMCPGCKWASPENPMKAFLYKTTTDGLEDLPRKVGMVRAKGTLDFAKGVS